MVTRRTFFRRTVLFFFDECPSALNNSVVGDDQWSIGSEMGKMGKMGRIVNRQRRI